MNGSYTRQNGIQISPSFFSKIFLTALILRTSVFNALLPKRACSSIGEMLSWQNKGQSINSLQKTPESVLTMNSSLWVLLAHPSGVTPVVLTVPYSHAKPVLSKAARGEQGRGAHTWAAASMTLLLLLNPHGTAESCSAALQGSGGLRQRGDTEGRGFTSRIPQPPWEPSSHCHTLHVSAWSTAMTGLTALHTKTSPWPCCGVEFIIHPNLPLTFSHVCNITCCVKLQALKMIRQENICTEASTLIKKNNYPASLKLLLWFLVSEIIACSESDIWMSYRMLVFRYCS